MSEVLGPFTFNEWENLKYLSSSIKDLKNRIRDHNEEKLRRVMRREKACFEEIAYKSVA